MSTVRPRLKAGLSARSILTVGAEYLFILLPILTLFFVIATVGSTHHNLLETSEWAFGAAVLFGQTIQKVATAASRTRAYTWQKAIFLITALMVFGLLPSLVTLGFVIHLPKTPQSLSLVQIALFWVGTASFLLFGSISHALLLENRDDTQ